MCKYTIYYICIHISYKYNIVNCIFILYLYIDKLIKLSISNIAELCQTKISNNQFNTIQIFYFNIIEVLSVITF